MSPVDETLEVVEKPKRASRKRVTQAIVPSAETTSAPKKRASRKKKAAVPAGEVGVAALVTEETAPEVATKPKKARTPRTPKVAKEKKEEKAIKPKKEQKESKAKKETKEDKAPERKAPTPLKARQTAIKTLRRQLIVVALLMCVGVGASAAVGRTDRGQIDVSRVISERNDRVTRGEEQGEVVPAQATPLLPDGGLVPATTNTPVEPTASSTPPAANATTTPAGNVPVTPASPAPTEKQPPATTTAPQ